jgi:hypothetical protein
MWLVCVHNTQRLVYCNCNRNGNLGRECSRILTSGSGSTSQRCMNVRCWWRGEVLIGCPPCPFLSRPFNDTVSNSDHIALKTCMAVNNEVEKIRRKRVWPGSSYYPNIFLMEPRKITNTSVRIVGDPIKIRIGHLPIASQMCWVPMSRHNITRYMTHWCACARCRSLSFLPVRGLVAWPPRTNLYRRITRRCHVVRRDLSGAGNNQICSNVPSFSFMTMQRSIAI